MTLYMAVTPDKYELPITVESTLFDLAEMFGTTPATIATSISRNKSGKRRGAKFVKVIVDD